jgi:hypothetical protein
MLWNMFPDLCRVIRHGPFLVRFQLKDKLDIIAGVPWRNMHVEMKHRLSCDPSIIGENVETLQLQTYHDRARNNLGCMKDIVQVCLGNGKEVKAMRLWNDKGMTEMDWVDIEDCNHTFVLIQHFCGQMMGDDLAECAFHRLSPAPAGKGATPSACRILLRTADRYS